MMPRGGPDIPGGAGSLDDIDLAALKDPAGIFDLIEVVGNGTYGQVRILHDLHLFALLLSLKI